MRFTLISWNVAGRLRVATRQAQWLLAHEPDVIALQDVTASTRDALLASFAGTALIHSVDTVPHNPGSRRVRRTGLLIVSRFPLVQVMLRAGNPPWPERILASRVALAPTIPLHLITAYIPPGSSNSWIKVETLEALYDHVFCLRSPLAIVAGDLNSPQKETSTGRVITWAQVLADKGEAIGKSIFRGRPGGRWDRAERSILEGLPALGYRDVFRDIHGYDRRTFSWSHERNSGTIKRRFDHLFASEGLRCKSCEYLHAPRQEGLSDHSPMVAVFSLV